MNRKQLIEDIAEQTKCHKKTIDKVLKAYENSVKTALENKEVVRLVDFGVFSTTLRKGRIGRDPRSGKEMQIPDRVVPIFKFAKNVNKKICG